MPPGRSLFGTLLLGSDDPPVETAFRNPSPSLGLSVDVVTRGGQLIRYLLSNRYDLVALDLTLPGIPGAALVEVVHRLAPDALLLVVAPEESLALETWVREGGAFYFLVKPVEEEEVALVLHDALSFLLRGKRGSS